MTGSAPQVTARVPATSANLGPGFDSFGLALDLHLTVRAVAPGEHRVVTRGQGAGELPTDGRNLVWRGLCAYADWAEVAMPDVSLEVDNPIPIERGLGSSSAAAVAGLVIGRALSAGPGTDHDLIELAARLEGHPDNAAAAVLGGVVVCVAGRAYRLDPVDRLTPLACVPTSRQSTEVARALLPGRVPLGDAAANGARAALVLAGLTGAVAWQPAAMTDVLHEPVRLGAMKDSGALVEALRGAGLAACLSGAGPTVLAIVEAGHEPSLVAVHREAAGRFTVRPSRWDRAGARVRTGEPSMVGWPACLPGCGGVL